MNTHILRQPMMTTYTFYIPCIDLYYNYNKIYKLSIPYKCNPTIKNKNVCKIIINNYTVRIFLIGSALSYNESSTCRKTNTNNVLTFMFDKMFFNH